MATPTENESQFEDFYLKHKLDEKCIKVLDTGFVRLVEISPRIVPKGRTPDFAAVRNARISFGLGLKSKEEDQRLLRYLYVNQHTSPFECITLTFHLRLPRFVATHFHRHRTASVNEFSQRYAEISENDYFHPSKVPESIRLQDKFNKQGSTLLADNPQTLELVREMESLVDELFEKYHQLIKMGVAKEVARSFLPLSTYTEMYYTMNLRNLLHFLELRYDEHTQKETRDYAQAMYDLLKIAVPETLDLFDRITRQGMHLSGDELRILRGESDTKVLGLNERRAFEKKKKYLLKEEEEKKEEV